MANVASPITGVIDEAIVIVEFGKYEGRTVRDVSEIDPQFYQVLAGERERGVYAIRRHRDKTFRLYINPLAQIEV